MVSQPRLGVRAPPSPFVCAICGRDVPVADDEQPHRAMIDGNLVVVCESCETEPATATWTDRCSYQVAEGGASMVKIQRAADKILRRGPSLGGQRNLPVRRRTPGFVLHRVPISAGGARRDVQEARVTFAGEWWADQARYLGLDGTSGERSTHLFERPLHRELVTAAVERRYACEECPAQPGEPCVGTSIPHRSRMTAAVADLERRQRR